MLTTSCGMAAGSTMSARNLCAAGESRSAGVSIRLSMRSTSSRDRVIGVWSSMSVLRVGILFKIATAPPFLNVLDRAAGGQRGGIQQFARQAFEHFRQLQQEWMHCRTD